MTPASGTVTPTGTVTFSSNGTAIGFRCFRSTVSGVATIPDFQSGGRETTTITAVYSGDSNYNGSSAAPLTQVVSNSGPNFAISVQQTSLMIAQGQSGNSQRDADTLHRTAPRKPSR